MTNTKYSQKNKIIIIIIIIIKIIIYKRAKSYFDQAALISGQFKLILGTVSKLNRNPLT